MGGGGITRSSATLALAGYPNARLSVDAMRPVLSRCPNYSQCLLGYRGEDIEVAEGMAPVCPECGTALVPKKRPRTALVPMLVNWLTIAMLVIAAWFAWPYVVKGWKKITTPPEEEAPVARETPGQPPPVAQPR